MANKKMAKLETTTIQPEWAEIRLQYTDRSVYLASGVLPFGYFEFLMPGVMTSGLGFIQ
jgi:hypothetical protein